MKEKVLYINLPDGANYREVKVTEDGRIGIVYTELSANSEDSSKLVSSIPKPVPLIGGSKVYQKFNWTHYWYCTINGGRDEFMHLYFEDLTEKDLLYDANGQERIFRTMKQKRFEANVLKALKNKPQEGYRWIPVYEPSKSSRGNILYMEGRDVLRGVNSYEWEKMFEEYSPKNGSRLASITTYFLLLLRWLKDGMATIEQLADDSKEIGNYLDNEYSSGNIEKTGQREFRGLYGFTGNTYKIVKDSKSSSGFSAVGGCYTDKGDFYPVADVEPDTHPSNNQYAAVGLLELTK